MKCLEILLNHFRGGIFCLAQKDSLLTIIVFEWLTITKGILFIMLLMCIPVHPPPPPPPPPPTNTYVEQTIFSASAPDGFFNFICESGSCCIGSLTFFLGRWQTRSYLVDDVFLIDEITFVSVSKSHLQVCFKEPYERWSIVEFVISNSLCC